MPSIVPEPYVITHIKRVTSSELDSDTGTNVIFLNPDQTVNYQVILRIPTGDSLSPVV